MDTGTKILIGAAVVVGGVVVYKMVTKTPPPIRASTVPNQQSVNVNGFLNLATSVFGYFTRRDPQPMVAPGQQGIDPNTGGVVLPPGETYGPPSPLVN